MAENADNSAYSTPASSRRFDFSEDREFVSDRTAPFDTTSITSTRERNSRNQMIETDSVDHDSAAIRAQIIADEEVAMLYAAAYADAIDQVTHLNELDPSVNTTDSLEHEQYVHENNQIRQRRGFRVPDPLSS